MTARVESKESSARTAATMDNASAPVTMRDARARRFLPPAKEYSGGS
jgi:hypothetical protein